MNMRIKLLILTLAFSGIAKGQNTFWQDWFLQADLDMSLQNPYLTWWLSDKLFPQNKNVTVSYTGNALSATINL